MPGRRGRRHPGRSLPRRRGRARPPRSRPRESASGRGAAPSCRSSGPPRRTVRRSTPRRSRGRARRGIGVSRSAIAMSPPPSPVVSTMVAFGRATAAPGTLGKPNPIDWYAVPTMRLRSGEATGQYMLDQPRKCPPSETTTRSAGSSSAMRAAAVRGSRRPSGPTPVPDAWRRAASRSSPLPHVERSEPRTRRRRTISPTTSATSPRT